MGARLYHWLFRVTDIREDDPDDSLPPWWAMPLIIVAFFAMEIPWRTVYHGTIYLILAGCFIALIWASFYYGW